MTELSWLTLLPPFLGQWQVYQGFDGPHTHKDQWRFALDFHRLEASWQKACGILNLPFQPLPKANASPDHGPMHMAYNASMAARVAERFAPDFEYFGYSTDSWQPGSAIESAT